MTTRREIVTITTLWPLWRVSLLMLTSYLSVIDHSGLGQPPYWDAGKSEGLFRVGARTEGARFPCAGFV